MYFTDNTTPVLIYTEQAAQSLIVCVCVLADIMAGAVYCGQQGLVKAFFLSQDGFIYYTHTHTHTHTHTLKRAERVYCGAYTSQRGAFGGRGWFS